MAGTVAFIVLDEEFVASHCGPMFRAAAELRLAVTVIGPIEAHRDLIETERTRGILLDAGRRRFSPVWAGYAAGQIAAELKGLKPDFVHCVALRSVLVGGAASAMAGIDRRVYSLPSLGHLTGRRGLVGAASRSSLRVLLAEQLRTERTRFLFEDGEDARRLRLEPSSVSVVGPGLDPDSLRPSAPPALPPVRVATFLHPSWPKGPDCVLEAVRLARAQGPEMELSVYGPPSNSRANRKRRPAKINEPSVTWREAAEDVASIWGEHHVACLPVRGGEGLPRMLADAASCGRPIVTSDLPGPRRLVRDGIEGFLVPPDDPAALAGALLKFVADPVLVPRMGAAARARVLHGFTDRDVADHLKRLYADMLGGAARA